MNGQVEKKRMLIVLNRYYPTCDSVTALIDNIIDPFLKYFDIIVICPRSDLRSPKDEKRNGIIIRRVITFWDWPVIIREQLIARIDHARRINRCYRTLVVMAISAFFFPLRLLSKSFGIYYMEGYKNRFGRLIQESILSSDVVLTTIMPYENAVTLCPILSKHPSIKWVIIQSDPFVDYSESEETIQKKEEQQNKWYERATLIAVQETILGCIYRASYKYKDKILPLFIPSMREISTNDGIIDHKKKRTLDLLNNTNQDSERRISCVYTGVFYSGVREPFFLIEVFRILHDLDSAIEVYILGEVYDNMLSLDDWMGSDWLFFCGRQSQEICSMAQHEADFLINVGNMIPNLVPSKVMQYIGTRKPLINLYHLKNDVVEEYLSDYPLQMSIYYDDFRNADDNATGHIEELRCFINSNKCKYADYDLIKEKYDKYSAQNYVETIMEQDAMKP